MMKIFINKLHPKYLGIPIEEGNKRTKRSEAKAVNFGIVYGISDYGLAQQLGITNKKAKEYIKQYLEKYNGVKSFMDNIVEKAKEEGYVETLFHRRRYIPELKSNNYMIRQFGSQCSNEYSNTRNSSRYYENCNDKCI